MTARKQLRAHALKHPEAWEDEPWPGDHVAKVGYGRDKSGWVVARFTKGNGIPLPLLLTWIDESYETVAATALPKRKR